MSDIRYCYYPRTRAPPEFVDEVVAAFQANGDAISTVDDDNGLKSDDVLDVVRDDLEAVGFDIEEGNNKKEGRSTARSCSARTESRASRYSRPTS
ncbi:hypothetical protein [Halorubrum ezzemoulense]|jgi:hypothetical protein|uniref:hypothetical protein n=1 Tax=Halorubrum ezzemoulense TaxID=337243 RepID=UPI00232CCF36|nr:hypothetical protein [Halorubrum ezzemoulense]MDB9254108.1 hypothetical protein [Halorubrum ezzemoulense]MDB9257501.1 hypothetical protein [Halorubrum ezzemoulense]MDB9278141.1 hypothetical protein [Halorubrum ezzemoulense]